MTREEKQKAIYTLKISAPIMAVTQEEFNDYIQTLNKIMDWLEQESIIKNDLGVDCISRQQAIDAFPDLLPNIGYNKKTITEILQEVPPVTPIRPKGHWEFIGDNCFSCTECGEVYTGEQFNAINNYYDDRFPKGCPNCGCLMEVEE